MEMRVVVIGAGSTGCELTAIKQAKNHVVLVDKSREALEAVGLDPARTTPVRGFSTGMAQRLKIAQALLHDPAVVFLDEPGSNLDPSGKDWLEGKVRSLAEAGKTIVLATNDRREMGWGDRHVALAG